MSTSTTPDVSAPDRAAFRFRPVAADAAARLRANAGVVVRVDASPGFPCRQCLRDAAVGEEVVLVSYDPFDTDGPAAASPYRGAGPIYLHRDDCSGRLDRDPLPVQLTSRVLSLRAFDASATMVGAAVVEGRDLASALERSFADPTVERVHVHNAGPGCLATVAERR